jgi:serine/threonine-protein kinase
VAPIACVVCLAIVLLHLSLLVRVAKQPSKRAIALILAASWVFVLAALTIDGSAFVGLGQYLHGYRIGSWALAFVAMAQSAALSREHIESLRNADGLNTTLAQRLAEIESLNDELRQRIGERTREIRAALGRTSHASLGPVVGSVVVGRYRVERLIGVGGMGRVYEVTSVRDGRRRALKVVGDAPTDEALSRFTREAELAARVVHPNVVSIVDFDVGEDGLPFIVMDLVVGVPLEGHRHRFGDVPWALGLLGQIAAGLEAIHARGIVHRDLKPANVLLENDSLRITDFGISCAAPTADDEVTAPATMGADLGGTLTKTGLVLGTPAYMAPELAHGARDATPAADAFGFAVMAFELLSGRRPFTEPAFLAAQRGERAIPFARLGELVPEVPDALADLVDRALRSDPPLRPSSHTFARTFGDVLAGSRAA